jgi:hypothetical protein
MSAIASPASIQAIQNRIAPLQTRLAQHPLYARIQTLAGLRLFMQSHVFAVWDFMSLLKSLQRDLTSVNLPWLPTPYPASRRFLNEIVLGEESDEYHGRPVSHFEIYLESMHRAGASTSAIDALLAAIAADPAAPLPLHLIPQPARAFVAHTFHVIRTGSLAAQAAAFTFGREDAIPAMFRALVRDLNHQMSGDLAQFVWYLERHIEVDGEDHGPLSLRMVADLCGADPTLWDEASLAAEQAIQARLALWDGILAQLPT